MRELLHLSRDDFMGRAEEAAIAVDTFLRAIITFRDHLCGAAIIWGCWTLDIRTYLPCT